MDEVTVMKPRKMYCRLMSMVDSKMTWIYRCWFKDVMKLVNRDPMTRLISGEVNVVLVVVGGIDAKKTSQIVLERDGGCRQCWRLE